MGLGRRRTLKGAKNSTKIIFSGVPVFVYKLALFLSVQLHGQLWRIFDAAVFLYY